jgi:lipoprotein-anchoring transpeptidase ErfK/SrfK
VRPGSMLGYSYYHSDRRNQPVSKKSKKSKSGRSTHKQTVPSSKLLLYLALILGVMVLINLASRFTTPKVPSNAPVIATTTTKHTSTKTASVAPVNACKSNTLDKQIIVSVGLRTLYACDKGTQVYTSPVVTGISYLAADITPIGTYTIYSKQTDTTLTGSDSTGNWNDHVYYWMPFLVNQYGTYGLHDATWRKNSDFGNIDPNSANASHGCVELPLSTAKWIYNWAVVGTPVTINS